MKNRVLLNAIIGDICGSVYEWHSAKEKPENLIGQRCKFTDDTVHTIAIAEAILNDPDNPDFKGSLIKWSRKYPKAGYGGMMRKWINSEDPKPYGSYGNGSAMRVSACGYIPGWRNSSIDSASITHNHPEGIKGAESVCNMIASLHILDNDNELSGNELIDKQKTYIRQLLNEYYPEYDLSISLGERRPDYKWDSTCQGSVPESIQCILEADSYEDAIKLAISMGGDSDTMACIAGSIAGVIWEKPDELVDFAYNKLPKDIISVIEEFDKFIKM